jgi:glycogen operon protein
LLFFDREDVARPSRTIQLDLRPLTYHYWHAFVPGVKAGQLYGYRVHGPSDPGAGAVDPAGRTVDPYGRGVVGARNYSRQAAQPGDNAATAMKRWWLIRRL